VRRPLESCPAGLAYWTDGHGDNRVIYITPGYQPIALDAKNAYPITSFAGTAWSI
jgi:hypothetical protein